MTYPPFEKAIEQLRALENENLNKQEEYKRYYSRLIEVVRVYLQEDAKIDALESTSDELLEILEGKFESKDEADKIIMKAREDWFKE